MNENFTAECGFLWWHALIFLCLDDLVEGWFIDALCLEAALSIGLIGVAHAQTEVKIAFGIFVCDVVVTLWRGAVAFDGFAADRVKTECDGELLHELFAIKYLQLPL